MVQEIARQIDHFTRELVDLCLFSVWHSRVHYSATRTIFATIFDVPESPIHRLSYAVLFMCIVEVVAEKGGGKIGMLMTIDGTNDDLICIDGVEKYTFTDADAGDLPANDVSDDDDDDEEEEEEVNEDIVPPCLEGYTPSGRSLKTSVTEY